MKGLKVSVEEAVRRGWIKPDAGQTPLERRIAELQQVRPRSVAPRAQVSCEAAPTKDRPARRADWEGDEQALLLEQFRLTHPAYADYLIHNANGGSRANAFEGYRMKRQGLRPGVSDLLLAVPRGQFHGLWIEFKASPPHNSRVSPAQKEWIAMMLVQGYEAKVCIGIDAAMAALNAYISLGAFAGPSVGAES